MAAATLKGMRCMCPIRKHDHRDFQIYAAWPTFRCYACKKSGDSIELVVHWKKLDGPKRHREAALMIQERFHGYKPAQKGLPSGGLEYLLLQHEMVQTMGINEDQAKAIGIGFAPRGTMINRVLFPLRTTEGRLVGYIGFNADLEPPLKLPKSFQV